MEYLTHGTIVQYFGNHSEYFKNIIMQNAMDKKK